MKIDVGLYSYFTERRASDKRWIATVAEFPELVAESRFRNRALNDLHDLVAATVEGRRVAGEPIPKTAHPPRDLLSSFGVSADDIV